MAIDGRTHYEGCWAERGHHDCANLRIAALEAQLKALDWTPITAENLPKKGDILAKFRKTKTGKPMGWCFTLDYWDNFNALRLRGWTHFRPINPPHAGGSNV
jgi:hypothetical protein